jgi:hypothetical protein
MTPPAIWRALCLSMPACLFLCPTILFLQHLHRILRILPFHCLASRRLPTLQHCLGLNGSSSANCIGSRPASDRPDPACADRLSALVFSSAFASANHSSLHLIDKGPQLQYFAP